MIVSVHALRQRQLNYSRMMIQSSLTRRGSRTLLIPGVETPG
jgi:hypothetical protein